MNLEILHPAPDGHHVDCEQSRALPRPIAKSEAPPMKQETVIEVPEVPVLSGQGGAPQAVEGADGTPGAAPAPEMPFDIFSLLMIAAIFLVFMTLMGGRKEKKRRQKLSKVGKHDRIMTRGGIIGSVVESKEDVVVIKVDESRDTRITLNRQYIEAVLEGTSKSEN